MGSLLFLCLAALTGCCGVEIKEWKLWPAECASGRKQGEFVGISSDVNGNQCETYRLGDKTG